MNNGVIGSGHDRAAISQHIPANFNLELSCSFPARIYVPKILPLLIAPGLEMHRFGIIGAGLLSIGVFTCCAASAADLPAKAPTVIPPAPVQFSWTGCFAGVHSGGAFSDDKIRTSSDFSSAGFIGGGQIGCDYQFASAWVAGVEGRAAWSSLTSSTPGSGVGLGGLRFPTQYTVSNDFLASATARLGYGLAGGWLIYARGGAAWTRENADVLFTFPGSAFAVDPSATRTQTGWTAGAGVDWAFAPHWSTNFEYNYYDFGRSDFLLTDTINRVTFNSNLKDSIHTVTVGLNYHF